jgi:uncharacterized protein involved in outer membrane biogenesis
MTNEPISPPRRRRGWLRAIGWVAGILIVLVIVLYFVATSSAFLKGVILPRASKAVGAEITVSDASISPFSQVVLHDLKVRTTGTEPLVSAQEVRLRYSLMDIIKGNIHVEEVAVSSPAVTLVQNPDGTSNLDPILKAMQAKPEEQKPAPPAKPSKPMQIDLVKLALTDATIRQVKLYKNGSQDLAELSHVNVSVDNIKNGQTGKLALSADINVQNNPPQPTPGGLLQAKLSGNFTLALSAELKPASIQGKASFQVAKAEGAMSQLAGFGSGFDCDVTPTDIKQVTLRFLKGETLLGQVRVSGPFDMEKTEGRIAIEILNIDKNLLNLAGAASGIDFGPTTISSTNEIQLAKAGAAITAAGQLSLSQFQLTRTNQTSPPLDLRLDYNVGVDRAASTAMLRTLTLAGRQKGSEILHGELSSPMTIAWGNTGGAVGESALNLAVTHLNLADWKPFLGDVAPAGDVTAKLQLVSKAAGKQLSFDLKSQIDNLTVGAGSNQISQVAVTMQASGQATDLKQFSFPEYSLQVARQDQPLVTVSGSGTYDQSTTNADMQLNAQLMLARLLQVLPQPDMKVSSGTAALKAHVIQKQQSQNVTGTFALTDFSGQVGNNSFKSFDAAADLDVGMTPEQIQIRNVAGKLSSGGNAGGSFNLSGTCGLANKTAQITLGLADFNQNGLGPFLQPMLAEKKLVSIAINGNASVQYDPQAASAVKADMQITNLVVNDPTGQFPATPLEARMQADASLDKQVATVRQFSIGLSPTSRAANQVQLTGQVDMSQTNAIQGNLKLVADSLDLTSYYDLFGGQSKARASAPGATSPTQTAPAPVAAGTGKGTEQEPEPIKLPVRNFTADASVGHLYLHEIDIADWRTTMKLDGGHVVVDPVKLVLNGAPVSSTVDLDMSVPGFKYDLAFNAQAIPLAPLLNSFQPDRKGILSGTLTAQAKITGAGTTGPSLQKNLASQFDMSSTNLNLSVDSIRGNSFYTRLLKTLVTTIAVIPELAKNPASTASSLLQGLTGQGESASSATSGGGAAAELKRSPINSIILRGTVGSGRVDLREALVQSPGFEAQASGTVTLAEVLTNSAINIPVTVSLERSVAQRINMAGNTPTNVAYARLPDFLTLKGTLGEPKSDINKVALAGAVLQGVGGKAGQAGSALQGISSLLGGSTSAGTNAGATNASPAENLLKGLFGPKKK